ncbi:MAG: 23S rRNA (guanosine2251-2'-O)-methyltransferase [Flavobacteriales bacterium]|jgi:23S rRNA (guanosine2251-2'-O)-methyltransferase
MKFSLLLFNIQSNTNIGQIIRTANAFGVDEICIIGRRKIATYGNQKTSNSTKFRHFYIVDDAIHHYRHLNYDLVGIEITEDSQSINVKTFSSNTVFILGNEGSGIQEDILKRCDYCVFIPQFGTGASINVNTASGIIFNAFCKNRTDYNDREKYKFTAKNT